MRLIDRLFSRGAGLSGPELPPVGLPPLLAVLDELLGVAPSWATEPEVIRARLADACRDVEVDPVDPAEFDALARGLDEGGLARLALVTLATSEDALGDAWPAALAARGVSAAVQGGFFGLAAGSPLLTIELLRESSLRLEELGRRWLASLGAPVAGETRDASRLALERLDYGRLLAEVERAKMSAEERVAYLKKLQDEHDASQPRRGKW